MRVFSSRVDSGMNDQAEIIQFVLYDENETCIFSVDYSPPFSVLHIGVGLSIYGEVCMIRGIMKAPPPYSVILRPIRSDDFERNSSSITSDNALPFPIYNLEELLCREG